MQVQIAKIVRPDHYSVAVRTVRRLQIGHRHAMISHSDGAAAVDAGRQFTAARHGEAFDLNLISSRR